jgi:hypothetical protein
MPTIDQLTHITAVEGDLSTTVTNGDGTLTTDWPDGTQRIDYADGSAMVSFPDKAVLNLYPDGLKTLNDANGAALDPETGEPLGTAGPVDTPPEEGADRLLRLMSGDERVADLLEAQGLVETFADALKGEIDPVEWVIKWIEMVLQVAKALETEERGCYYRGWCYAVLYSALDMSTPAQPTFANSLQGPRQDDLDRQSWDRGVGAANFQLADGTAGTGLRNRVLLRVAATGASPLTTLRDMYQTACDHSGDSALRQGYEDILTWPDPLGA